MPEWVVNIPAEFWAVLSEMAPYLLFGFLMAGVLSVFVSPVLVERHLGGKGLWSVVKAAAFGVPLPLCSCGVIPVSASLRRHGAGKGATTAFLISTPQDGVDSIMVTYGLLGGVYAIFRPIVALVTGIAGGVIVNVADGNDAPQEVSDAAGHDQFTENGHGRIRRMFTYGFDTLPQDIGKALLVGLVLAALISAVVPKDYFASVVPPGIWQMLILMAAGIPVYVCATASVPLVYALIVAGVSPGAAFAFLMTGPATNVATIATVWKVMGKRITMIYLGVMLVGALVGGLMLDRFITGEQIVGTGRMGWMLPPIIKYVSAVVLLGVLFVAIVRTYVHGRAKGKVIEGETTKLAISGMTCSHCAESVRRALLECPGVEGVEVNLANGAAAVAGEGFDLAVMKKAIEELGYNVADKTNGR
jgi:uncharacterized membrane protein YraQ (UPF0718 family)